MTTVTSVVSELTSRVDSGAVPGLTNPRNRDVTDADFPTSPASAALPAGASPPFLAGNICSILPAYSTIIYDRFFGKLSVAIDPTLNGTQQLDLKRGVACRAVLRSDVAFNCCCTVA